MPTLEDLRLEARLSISSLSREAKVDIKTVRRALDGENVQKLKAIAILDALAEKLNRPLKLEDVDGLHYT
jgi:predicted transcriptional regulator